MASGSSALGRGHTEDRRRFCFGYLFAGCKLVDRHQKLSASFASDDCKLDSNLRYTSIKLQLALAFQNAAMVWAESVRLGRNRSDLVDGRFSAEQFGAGYVDNGYLKAAIVVLSVDLACLF